MGLPMLTTIDNPYDPFTQFDQWEAYDRDHGYHTLSLLGRVVVYSDDLSEASKEQAIDDAVLEIARINASGIHKVIYENGSN
jgi:hypothetical protein